MHGDRNPDAISCSIPSVRKFIIDAVAAALQQSPLQLPADEGCLSIEVDDKNPYALVISDARTGKKYRLYVKKVRGDEAALDERVVRIRNEIRSRLRDIDERRTLRSEIAEMIEKKKNRTQKGR